MITFNRKYGSQRISKLTKITLDEHFHNPTLVFQREDSSYLFIEPDTDEEWRALLSAVHRAYRRFNDIEERKQQLQIL